MVVGQAKTAKSESEKAV